MVIFKRYPQNPILAPIPTHSWESKAVFNPAAVFFNGKFHLFYRSIGEYQHYVSSVGHAISSDGVHFERDLKPSLVPVENYEKFGIEDVRVNPLEKRFFLTYTVLNKPAKEGGKPHQVGLIETNDFTSFKRLGVVTPKEFCSRDAVLFPEKINGLYVMFHRPLYFVRQKDSSNTTFPSSPGIWTYYSENLEDWEDCQLVIEPRYWWEENKIGNGPPPIKTERGWLVIYHGVDKNLVYRVGIALLDLEDPRKVIARLREPILEPTMNYEKIGDTPNVIFPTGLILKDRFLYLYYGAADKTCCLVTARLEDLLRMLS